MKYRYLQNGYHPKDVSFEVTALLREESNAKITATVALKDTILGYNTGSYLKDVEMGFNPVTNQEVKFKYLKSRYQHHLAYEEHKKEKLKKAWILKNEHKRNLSKKVQEAFFEVIQNMLLKYGLIISGRNLAKKHINFLEIQKVNKELTKASISIKYTIHPHVDALLRERERSNYKRFRGR